MFTQLKNNVYMYAFRNIIKAFGCGLSQSERKTKHKPTRFIFFVWVFLDNEEIVHRRIETNNLQALSWAIIVFPPPKWAGPLRLSSH